MHISISSECVACNRVHEFENYLFLCKLSCIEALNQNTSHKLVQHKGQQNVIVFGILQSIKFREEVNMKQDYKQMEKFMQTTPI